MLISGGVTAGVGGVVAIPLTAGTATAPLEMTAGAAIVGGIHLVAAGVGCLVAGAIDMGLVRR